MGVALAITRGIATIADLLTQHSAIAAIISSAADSEAHTEPSLWPSRPVPERPICEHPDQIGLQPRYA